MKGQTFKIGNTTIIIRESITNEANIKRCYDACNELFRGNPECFYTRDETSKKNLILFQKKDKEAISY